MRKDIQGAERGFGIPVRLLQGGGFSFLFPFLGGGAKRHVGGMRL